MARSRSILDIWTPMACTLAILPPLPSVDLSVLRYAYINIFIFSTCFVSSSLLDHAGDLWIVCPGCSNLAMYWPFLNSFRLLGVQNSEHLNDCGSEIWCVITQIWDFDEQRLYLYCIYVINDKLIESSVRVEFVLAVHLCTCEFEIRGYSINVEFSLILFHLWISLINQSIYCHTRLELVLDV